MDQTSADPVVDAILSASRALVAITTRSLTSTADDVTVAQFRSLLVLAGSGPQTVSALADHLAVHASTMTRMCNRLVTRGLVVRAPSAVDRREVVIALTAMGTSVVETVMTARREQLGAVVRQMTDNDRDVIVSALNRFSLAAGEAPGTPDAQSLATQAAGQLLEE